MYKGVIMRYLSLLSLLLFVLVASAQEADFELALLHSSTVVDNHRIGDDGRGGTAREATIIAEAREAHPNILLFDMGDRYINPFYYARNAEIMNELGYNAMTLGNHEFNGGNVGLLNFLEAVDFPILAANIDFSASPILEGRISPYTIIDVNGEQIGVIGLAEEATPALSSPGPELIFLDDEVAVTQGYIDELTGLGVNKILLLAHREAAENVVLASSLDGVDVILGGSDDVLLSNTAEDADFPYPIESRSLSGAPVLVVQTPERNLYLGQAIVHFDEAGILTSWSGDNVLLDESIAENADFATMLEELYAADAADATEVGSSETVLLGGDPCREEECTMGNLITDAIRDYGGTQLAVYNAGGIRASIDLGPISDVQIIQVLPFGNLLSTMELQGQDLVAMLEHSVALGGDSTVRGSGRFLQVSGMRFSWNPTKPVGSRVEGIDILQEDGSFLPIDVNAIYSVTTNDFIRNGGDEYSMLAENAIDPFDFGPPVDEVLLDYVMANSPVAPTIEGRITRLGE
jgi:5'-nucleotidase/UDP-sugar diphosphatase